MDVKVGDTIEILSNKVDTPPRHGKVLEVIDEDPAELRVQWDDGHESVIYPNTGMVRVVSRDRG
jgi:hypothetical protein